ncbi:MAG: tRNA uridine-5-carboxymethylaminomethyl(34) synthesis GTPase MnmE [Clostridia bacterium]|nr:tRNA uridine-5-carboxymethylaminomethyl(34) synthesis GTPase MnmE [Clostridia bacterium]
MTAYQDYTIAAISTPPGSGGIGIIRISGNRAVEVADGIFTKNPNGTESNKEVDCIRAAGEVARMSSYTLKHGYIYDPETGEPIDECLISFMQGPRSYTGEDVIEINSHGGYAVMKKILSLLYKRGVRAAQPGEFTKRAFLNGRIALSEAEAVSDLIQAKTEESRKAAFSQLSGAITREIHQMTVLLSETLAKIEVAIDYPEYEEDEQVSKEAVSSLEEVAQKLQKLIRSYQRGRILREGFRVAICGRPNAGKSSLLNAMTGSDRAIVTDIAGTTRDTIEETVDLDGFTLYVTDTAGLRETEDTVEQIGVRRAYEEIQKADLVVFLADSQSKPKDEAALLNNIVAQMPVKCRLITAINKEDLLTEAQRQAFQEIQWYTETAPISFSVREQGAEPIFNEIRKILDQQDFAAGSAMITNERHLALVEQALAAIAQAKTSVEQGQPLDLISYDVWECARCLGEITGENVTDDVVDMIFSKFCLGK